NGLAVGDQINISGVTGNTAANGLHTVQFINGGKGGPKITLEAASNGNGGYTGGGTYTRVNAGTTTNENVFVLAGKGNGSFQTPVPYLAGGMGVPAPAPSYLGVTPSALVRVTTFASGGTVVNSNLVANG